MRAITHFGAGSVSEFCPWKKYRYLYVQIVKYVMWSNRNSKIKSQCIIRNNGDSQISGNFWFEIVTNILNALFSCKFYIVGWNNLAVTFYNTYQWLVQNSSADITNYTCWFDQDVLVQIKKYENNFTSQNLQ